MLSPPTCQGSGSPGLCKQYLCIEMVGLAVRGGSWRPGKKPGVRGPHRVCAPHPSRRLAWKGPVWGESCQWELEIGGTVKKASVTVPVLGGGEQGPV